MNSMEVRSLTSVLSQFDDFAWQNVRKLDLDLERWEKSSGWIGLMIFKILTTILNVKVDEPGSTRFLFWTSRTIERH